MKYKQPEEFFKYIIEKGNINIINDNQKCLAMALDLLDYEKTNFKLLKIAIENNVYKELFKAYNSDSNDKTHFINKAIKILSDDCCIKDDKAVEIVGWFASVIYPNEWGSFVNQKQELLLPLSERDVPIYNENFKGKIDEPNSNSILDNKNWTLEGIGLEMVYCPTGEFMMGSPAPVRDKKNYHGIFTDEIINGELGRNNNEILHKVILSDAFMIGKYPVTQEQYFKIMGNRPSFNSNCDNNPVENISLNEAKEFCEKLNFLFKNQLPKNYSFSLPSEAQWEYACRAGTTTSLNSGKNITSETGECYNLDEVAWYESNSNGITHPVGLKKPNAWGIYDMHGNVWEWCKDLGYDYSHTTVTDPIGPTAGSSHSLRGGGCNSAPRLCRSANRSNTWVVGFDKNFGFRVALVPID